MLSLGVANIEFPIAVGSGIVTAMTWVTAVAGFDPWPENFHMLWTWPKKKKMANIKYLEPSMTSQTGAILYYFYEDKIF